MREKTSQWKQPKQNDFSMFIRQINVSQIQSYVPISIFNISDNYTVQYLNIYSISPQKKPNLMII